MMPLISPALPKTMKIIQTFDHGQQEPAGPLSERGPNLPAGPYPRQTFQKMDRLCTLFEEAVLTTDTVGDRGPVFPLTGDPIQKPIRKLRIQGVQATADAATVGGGCLRNGALRFCWGGI